jgi:hypothetical protein
VYSETDQAIKNIFLGELIKSTPADPNAPKGIDIAKKSANSAKERQEKVLEKAEQNSK